MSEVIEMHERIIKLYKAGNSLQSIAHQLKGCAVEDTFYPGVRIGRTTYHV